jgi:F0F1-type ATP synthase assembly protein I
VVTRQSDSEVDIRPTARRILIWQAGTGVAIAAACLALWGRAAAVSALAGAAIGVIANLYMTLKALRPARTPGAALGALYLGQLVKVALTVGMFVAIARMPGLVWPALLVAYVATLVVFWWVPFRAMPRPAGPGAS